MKDHFQPHIKVITKRAFKPDNKVHFYCLKDGLLTQVLPVARRAK